MDIQAGVPDGRTHISGKRLQPVCRKLAIDYSDALVGWTPSHSRYYPDRPEYDGVMVATADAPKLLAAIAVRDASRERRQKRDTAKFADRIRSAWPGMPEADVLACAERATEIDSRRVGRSSTATDPVRAAVVAYARHKYTGYDRMLSGRTVNVRSYYDRQDTRDQCRADIRDDLSTVLSRWEPTDAEVIARMEAETATEGGST